MQDNSAIEQVLGSVFDAAREGLRAEIDADDYEQRRHDFIFHMTDWQGDLKNLADLLQNPRKYDEDAASTLLIGFLYHVIPHLNAAGRLLLDQVADPFCQAAEKQKD